MKSGDWEWLGIEHIWKYAGSTWSILCRCIFVDRQIIYWWVIFHSYVQFPWVSLDSPLFSATASILRLSLSYPLRKPCSGDVGGSSLGKATTLHVGAPAPIKWQLNDENDDQQWIWWGSQWVSYCILWAVVSWHLLLMLMAATLPYSTSSHRPRFEMFKQRSTCCCRTFQ